jgi:CTP synthase
VRESLRHAGLFHERIIKIDWIQSEDLEKRDDLDEIFRHTQGIIVPGGFGTRGIEGMIKAAQYARTHHIPYLGLCLGMQVMVIEFARHVLGTSSPNSTEFDASTPHPVIDLMPEQRKVAQKGASMRLGNYPCRLTEGTRAAEAYGGAALIQERHRHRYEFNNEYRQSLVKAGLVLSGISPDDKLVEVCEMAGHPWMVASQFHPEFVSRPNRPHPLFSGFIGAAKNVLREGDQPLLPLRSV